MATPCGRDNEICQRGFYLRRNFARSTEAKPGGPQRQPTLDSGEVYQKLPPYASGHSNDRLDNDGLERLPGKTRDALEVHP